MRIARLGLLGRLDRYIGGLFLASYATAFLLVVGLVVILDLGANLDYFEPWKDGTRPSILLLVRFYLLNVPFLFLQVAPFVTVIAGLFTVTRLNKKNELVAALSAGVSAQRLLAPVVVGGFLAAGGMFLLREVATTQLGPKRDLLKYVLENQRYDFELTDFWLRDRATNAVQLGVFRPAVGDPPVAEILELNSIIRRGDEVVRITAERAVYAERGEGTGWRLENGLRQKSGEDDPVSTPIEWLETLEFDPHDVMVMHKGRVNELELSFSELLLLLRRDPDNAKYQTLLQYHLTFPLANIVLLLATLPFLLGRERGHSVEGLVTGFLMCIGYFCVDFITRSLGMDGALTPLMASWLPILLFGSLGATLAYSMRS